MEQKLVRVPFDVNLAEEITNGTKDGRIVTRGGRNARIVCFNAHRDSNIIALVEDKDGIENPMCYVNDGIKFITGESKCDLMLEIPEYMTFKDGDILYARVNNGNWYIFIYRDNGKNKTFFCAALDNEGTLFIEKNYITSSDHISELRFATEEEKQKLIEALKSSENPKAKEYLKRFFGIEEKPKCQFKPFDKVLVRCSNESQWSARFFDRMFEGDYACIDSLVYKQCIPYNEQTAHLLGTTENWEKR